MSSAYIRYPNTGGGGGGVTIGNAITGGTANRVLYEGAGNTLSETSSLTFDGTNLFMPHVTNSAVYNTGALGTGLGSAFNPGYVGLYSGGVLMMYASGVSVSTNGHSFIMEGGNFGYDQTNLYPPGRAAIGSGGLLVGLDSGTTNPAEKLDVRGNAVVTGNIKINTAGSGLFIKEGSNAKMGITTLVSGVATVNTTAVTASSRIFLTIQVPHGNTGALFIVSRVPGTSFSISSSTVLDLSDVAWIIYEPAP